MPRLKPLLDLALPMRAADPAYREALSAVEFRSPRFLGSRPSFWAGGKSWVKPLDLLGDIKVQYAAAFPGAVFDVTSIIRHAGQIA